MIKVYCLAVIIPLPKSSMVRDVGSGASRATPRVPFWPPGAVYAYSSAMPRALLIASLLLFQASLALAQQTAADSASAIPIPSSATKPDSGAQKAGKGLEPVSKELATGKSENGLEGVWREGFEPMPVSPAVAAVAYPSVLTSESSLILTEAVLGAATLEWLQGISPPELPVRWDDRLVRLLEHYRTVPQGRALIRGLFQRAGRYGPMIKRKLREADLPEDLVYVAMVESGFDPSVRSSAGAVGLWQFMKNTGEEYGLEQTRWVDERANPERSTDAAARLLGDLYQRLGSWELALASYNMGYSSLLRSMQKYNTNDFWLLSELEAGLPYETVFYVAKIMACAVIGHNLERFGLADLQPDPQLETAPVTVPGGVGLFRVARAAGITTDELQALNPDIKRGRVPPDVREWQVRIPAERRARFLQRWEKIRPKTSSHRKYVVRFGERLPDVARAFGTSERGLRRLNELDDGEEVGPGVELLVPDVKPRTGPGDEPPVLGVPPRSFVYQDRKRVFYRVATQDTLQEIARFFRVSVDEIVKWNGIDPDAVLTRGLFLQLFVPHRVDLTRAVVVTPEEARILVVGSEEFFDFHEAQRDRVRIRYRIRPGDTMQSLADRFELSVGSIARINRFSRYKELEPDREIIVYVPRELAESLR